MKFALLTLAFMTSIPTFAHGPYVQATLSVKQAETMMTTALAEAERQKVTVAIIITDEAGQIVLSHRMDGALPHAFDLGHRKARTAALTRASTKLAADEFAKGNKQLLAIDGMLPIAGGFPVKYRGGLIGAIGVSGSPPTIDESVAAAGLNALANHDADISPVDD